MIWSDSLICRSKINLRLKVTARREDGYHELASCFLPLENPADTLTLTVDETRPGLTLDAPGFPVEVEPEANLVSKAARLFAEKSGISPCWHFELQKHIPIAAGMGGGSSNAAGVLKLLNRCYNKFSPAELADIAVKIGADVPFFLLDAPAWATGIGEKLSPLPTGGRIPAVLVIAPGFPVSAKWGFTALDKKRIAPDEKDMADTAAELLAADAPFEAWQKFCHNDLGFAIFEKFPLTALYREFLLAHRALTVQVCGSGPSLFALFTDAETALAAGKALRADTLNDPVMRIFCGSEEL